MPASPILLPARYRTITGDATTADAVVAANISDATDLLDDLLDRFLRKNTYVEKLDIFGWQTGFPRVYPSACPVLSIGAGISAVIADDFTVAGLSPDFGLVLTFDDALPLGARMTNTLTYVGGYDDQTVPTALARACARIAHAMCIPGSEGGGMPPTMTSASVGDVRIAVDSKLKSCEMVDYYVPGLTNMLAGYVRRTG